MTTVHVIPRDDIVAHTASDDCICGPTNKFVDSRDGSGGFICTHHSLDRREAHE